MEARTPTAGEGQLTLGLITRHARGMLRIGYLRIALVALVLFVPPSMLAAFVEHAITDFEEQRGPLLGISILVAVASAASLRLLGPVVYAGYLDEAVGKAFFHGHQHRFADVLRSLPWIRLLVADIVVMGMTTVLAALFIVPGMVFYTLFGLVGPVLVQERRGLIASFTRTLRISLKALLPIALLVLVPTLIELTIHEAVFRALHGAGLGFELVIEWMIAALIGGTIGLLEVALATELMARDPEPEDAGTRQGSAAHAGR